MKKYLIILLLSSCNSNKTQTTIEVDGNQADGYTVRASNSQGKEIYFKYSDDPKDTTAMKSEALQEAEKIENENH